MKIFTCTLFFFSWAILLPSQSLYFPPLTGETWETTSPGALGWCEDKIQPLYEFLDDENTKAFLLLKDGKIVLEKYFDQFTRDSFWYWASAGKSLTAFLVGVAQQEGHLSIEDKASDYLGKGWTACPPDKESLITVRHQLSMTSGLDDGVEDPYCTLDTCLIYLADSGTRWAYHNGPYTLLDQVIENATGSTLNSYYVQKLRSKIGMNGIFLPSGYNNVLYSTPRSMARFGLLILNKGTWENTPVLADTAYFNQMVNTSQDINPSYGYLWWLNGKSSYMVPQLQFQIPGSLNIAAPNDMFAAMGKNGQFLNIVPSQNLVMVRMGDAPDNSLVPFLLNNQIWEYLNEIMCGATATPEQSLDNELVVFPNPASEKVTVQCKSGGIPERLEVLSLSGERKAVSFSTPVISLAGLPEGTYLLRIQLPGVNHYRRFVKSSR